MRENMEVVIVGHVDHGKSTLIGRLLYDTGSIAHDRYEKIEGICREQGKKLEFAFLLDAFEEEQKQGITIDVSRVRFATAKRDYQLIDTPGHKEFLKNMFSGASSAQAALIMVDAAEGIREQSRQHAYLLHLLGIRQIAVVVSKMDLVGYSQEVFENIKTEYTACLEEFDFASFDFIPVDSPKGVNITASRPGIMDWYSGRFICDVLDSFKPCVPAQDGNLRVSVQDIYKFDGRRIIAGRVECGVLEKGQLVSFWPVNKTARVESIQSWPDDGKTSVGAGNSVAFTLDQQLFIERGHMVCDCDDGPCLSDIFEATLFWLGSDPLEVDKAYTLRLGTSSCECVVREIKEVIGADTSFVQGQNFISQYQAGRVIVKTRKVIAFDDFSSTPSLGRFVLIDKKLVCGGGIAQLNGFPNLRTNAALQVKSNNISWHFNKVTARERQALNGHKGAVVWMTGLSGSGKSTIAVELEKKLFEYGVRSYVLDGDNLRYGLNADIGFAPEDRAENIRRAGQVAKLFADAGMVVITAFISPYNSGRQQARDANRENFLEVFLDCPVDECSRRDPKGLYAKAQNGQIKNFTGVSSPYEVPIDPDVHLKTDEMGVAECVDAVIERLCEQGIIQTRVMV